MIDAEQRFSDIEERLAQLEAAPRPAYVWVVMRNHEPAAVVTSETEAEDLVRRWLPAGLHRAVGSACWFKLPMVSDAAPEEV